MIWWIILIFFSMSSTICHVRNFHVPLLRDTIYEYFLCCCGILLSVIEIYFFCGLTKIFTVFGTRNNCSQRMNLPARFLLGGKLSRFDRKIIEIN